MSKHPKTCMCRGCIDKARQMLAPWGGWSPLLHAATVAMPKHLRDDEMVWACGVLAQVHNRGQSHKHNEMAPFYTSEDAS